MHPVRGDDLVAMQAAGFWGLVSRPIGFYRVIGAPDVDENAFVLSDDEGLEAAGREAQLPRRAERAPQGGAPKREEPPTLCPALLDKRQLYPNNGLRCLSWSELGRLAPRPGGRCALAGERVGACHLMKIATFNINNVNRRLPNLLQWLKDARPDVVCLQELKCSDREFPAAAIRRAGYHAIWRGQRTWNGVAILSRPEPIVTRTALPGDPGDAQARYIEAAIAGIVVGCIYLPNGNPQPGPKFDYKLAWFKRLHAHARTLLRDDVPVVLAGDFNVAPTEIDIYPTSSWDDDALVQPESRTAYARLIGQGWTDAIRERYGQKRVYTFWHYLRNRWERDAGLRLDHVLLSPDIASRLKDARVDRSVRGQDGASDHAPVWVTLRSSKARR